MILYFYNLSFYLDPMTKILSNIIMSENYLPLLDTQVEFKNSRWQSVLSNYDPSSYPADLNFARNHGKAQRIGQYVPPK